MPLSGVTEAAKDYHAKKAAAESGGTAFLSLDDGEEATLRFLEEGADFVTYYEDQVKVWNGGITIAEDLDHLDGKYGGLTSRDFEVMRRGKKLDTSYTILPSGEARALSANDEKLRGAKFDLNQLKKAPEYEQFYNYRSGGGSNGASGSNGDAPPTRESPFRRRDRTES
jgi:hypothetical protein